MGFNVKVKPADINEDIPNDIDCVSFVEMLAVKKARETAKECDEDDMILGADTVVVYDDLIMGKPADESEAFAMLNMLSGNWHDVYTGFAVIHEGKEVVDYCRTRVKFRDLSEEEIEAYVKTGEYEDKAGGYGIQERGAALVEQIDGDYFNVVGLPVCTVAVIFKEANPPLLQDKFSV